MAVEEQVQETEDEVQETDIEDTDQSSQYFADELKRLQGKLATTPAGKSSSTPAGESSSTPAGKSSSKKRTERKQRTCGTKRGSGKKRRARRRSSELKQALTRLGFPPVPTAPAKLQEVVATALRKL